MMDLKSEIKTNSISIFARINSDLSSVLFSIQSGLSTYLFV